MLYIEVPTEVSVEESITLAIGRLQQALRQVQAEPPIDPSKVLDKTRHVIDCVIRECGKRRWIK